MSDDFKAAQAAVGTGRKVRVRCLHPVRVSVERDGEDRIAGLRVGEVVDVFLEPSGRGGRYTRPDDVAFYVAKGYLKVEPKAKLTDPATFEEAHRQARAKRVKPGFDPRTLLSKIDALEREVQRLQAAPAKA